MILQAAEMLALDLSRSWLIGDAPRDVEAGRAAGCRTILFTDDSLPPSPAAGAATAVEPDFEVSSLAQAMDVIEANRDAPRRAPASADATPPSEHTIASALVGAPATAPPPQPPDPIQPEASPTPPPSLARVETLLDEILHELRRRDGRVEEDFSVSKLLAGIVQVLAIGLVFVAYLNRDDVDRFYPLILFSLFVQMLVVALLIMGKQR
jgi:hypothetical protein